MDLGVIICVLGGLTVSIGSLYLTLTTPTPKPELLYAIAAISGAVSIMLLYAGFKDK